MTALSYIAAVQEKINQIVATQMEPLQQAADAVQKTVEAGGIVYLFGTGHSHMLAEEGHYRAGGLVQVCPILTSSLMMHEGAVVSTDFERLRGIAAPLLARYRPTPQDTILVFSNSGVNAVPVEMAIAAREAGLTVIAVTSVAYANTIEPRVDGKRLADVGHIVIDNQGVPGDALVTVHESGLKAGPLSTVVGAMILNAILVEVVSRIGEKGQVPPVYISANIPGAIEHNNELLEAYRDRNPHL